MKIQEDLKEYLNLKTYQKEFKKKKPRGRHVSKKPLEAKGRHVSKKPLEAKGVTVIVDQIDGDASTPPPSNILSIWQKGGEDWRIQEKYWALESDNLPCDKCQIRCVNGMVWASETPDPHLGYFHHNCRPYHTIKVDGHIYQITRDWKGRIFKRLVTKELLESQDPKPEINQKWQIKYIVFSHIVIAALLFTIAYNV
jgi:hypothetical protein